LDQEEGMRYVIRNCIEDGLMECEGWDETSHIDCASQLPIRWRKALAFLNDSQEGVKGNMQVGTAMLNLIEAKILVREKVRKVI